MKTTTAIQIDGHRTPRSSSKLGGALLVFTLAALSATGTRSAGAQDYGQPGYATPEQANGQANDQGDQVDPPSRVARISQLNGDVGLEPAGAQDFSAAEVNYPLTNGDRLYSNGGALTELEAGGLAMRLGQQTDFTVTALSDELAQFGLAQGSVHVRAFALDPDSVTEVDTPNAAINFLQPGDVRVDVSADGNTTIVTLLSGVVEVTADGVDQQLNPGQSFRIRGSQPAAADYVRRARADDLDSFSNQRDSLYQQEVASDDQYVNQDTIGAADLAQSGDWSQDGDNGPVWYPRGVAVDWAPYSVGHWAYVRPWGWTWVEAEPWGFTPFHYGRWIRVRNRWGWIPGPIVVRPVYSPALVVFIGGGSVGFTGWFPLGPREAFVPWYRTSAVYVNRVNVSNIYNRNSVEVRNVYNNHTTNIYVNKTVNVTYINRSSTVAVPQNAFASGRNVHDNQYRGNQSQLQHAPVVNRPPVAPARPTSTLPPSPVHAPAQPRPVLPGHTGNQPGQPAPVQRPAAPVGGTNGNGPGRTPGQGRPAPTSQAPVVEPNTPIRGGPKAPPGGPVRLPQPAPAPSTQTPEPPTPIRGGPKAPPTVPVRLPEPAPAQPTAQPAPVAQAPVRGGPKAPPTQQPVSEPYQRPVAPPVQQRSAPTPQPEPRPVERPAPQPQPEQRPQPQPQRPQPQPRPQPESHSPPPQRTPPAKDDDKKKPNR